jgi:hypothetical protein
MFMVGLEVSLPTMIAARTDVFGAGSLQVGLTSLIVTAGARLAGVDWRAAVLLGGAVAMSSTAISLKQLADQGEISSQHGRLALESPPVSGSCHPLCIPWLKPRPQMRLSIWGNSYVERMPQMRCVQLPARFPLER